MNLYPFQETGVDFALRHPKVLIADEMGLGKSVQALTGIERDKNIRSVLIVCPKSLITNWRAEARNWLSTSRLGAVTLITNYEALQKLIATGQRRNIEFD